MAAPPSYLDSLIEARDNLAAKLAELSATDPGFMTGLTQLSVEGEAFGWDRKGLMEAIKTLDDLIVATQARTPSAQRLWVRSI